MKNICNLFKKISILVLVLMVFFVSPQYSRCEEPELSSIITIHSLTFPPQNDISGFH